MEPKKRQPIAAHILRQVEQCGWAGHLSQEHRERREDKNGTRDVRTEIMRSWAVNDQAQLPDAHAAQMWLMSIASGDDANVRSVGESLDLLDAETGEVLAGGRTDAIIDTADGEVLVVAWVVGEHYDMPEPEEDLGLVAMGLAACNGKPFKVAHVYLRDGEAFPRRSPVFPVSDHPALLTRIRKAAGAPRIPCPGSWCGHCRMAHHCVTWMAKAKAALVAMTNELVLNSEGKIEAAPGFELSPENAGPFAERLELLGKVYDFAKDLRDQYVRRGGVVMLDGKQLVMSQRSGRVTVTTSEFKPLLDGLKEWGKKEAPAVAAVVAQFVTSFEATIKTGNPYDQPAWKKPSSIGGRR